MSVPPHGASSPRGRERRAVPSLVSRRGDKAMSNSSPLGHLGRREVLRAGGIAAAALAAGPGLAACSRTEPAEGQSLLESLREKGSIKAAINNEPPFGY